MRATFAVLMIWILPAHPVWAQLDLLTPREVSRIVEQIPPVVEAAKGLQCPTVAQVTADQRRPATMNVEVRCGGFHDRYVVDRRTGTVTTWGDNPRNVGDRASEILAEQLLTQARSRLLPLRESRCLVLEAARSLSGWGGAAGSITIEPLAAPGSPGTVFWLHHKSLSPPTEVRALLYVDPRTGHVRNEGSAAEVMSAGLGELLAKLIALRSPPLLSDEDALSIALKVPALAAVSRRKGCSLIGSSALTPEQAQIAPACDDHYVEGLGVVVNLRDGHVSDADTGNATDAPEAGLLARSLVYAVREARVHLQQEVDANCGGPERR